MEQFYPLTFKPIFFERIWGGRRIESLYGKPLPRDIPIGESWEVADRPGMESVIANGPLQGQTLRWLMENHHQAIMGTAKDTNGRFPLLVKILDAHSDLSVQVHPSSKVAPQLGGEPKTEMWLVVHAEENGHIYTGLKRGVTRESFLEAVEQKQVASLLHCNEVKVGDSILIPPGGIHSLCKGVMVFEFQQNSDTTYRVYDWDRVDAHGKPRPLHLENALKSIDWGYIEPDLIHSNFSRNSVLSSRFLVNEEAFVCDEYRVKKNQRFYISNTVPVVIGMVSGEMRISGGGESVQMIPGKFCLLPPGLERASIETATPVTYLMGQPQAEFSPHQD
jgi:mannose-6-phosphate isomerase